MTKRFKNKVQKPDEVQLLNFQVKEAYKTARANITYSILKQECKKITFTSSMKSEGKTVTSTNIAFALAQQVDTKVLVIDCDLRAPNVHNVFHLEPTPGLTNYLTKECSVDEILLDTDLPNLKVICYGAIPPNPSELLASEAMSSFIRKLEKDFDYIIFDTPPIGIVSDAIPLVKASDGVVIVAKHNQTTYPELSKTIEILKRTDGKILGVVINRVNLSASQRGKYYNNYGYYG